MVGDAPTIRPQLACLTGSDTHKSHISTLRDDLTATASFYHFEYGSLNLFKCQITTLPGGLHRQSYRNTRCRCRAIAALVLCLLSVEDAGKCSVQLYITFLLSDCVCVSTHSCGLIHCSALFSKHNLMMSSPHCHGPRYTATKHMHTHLIWQQKQQCLLGHSIQSH